MSMLKGNTFACDLVAHAKLHILFLKQSHLCMTSCKYDEPSILIESLRRYQVLWLPLVASELTTTKQLIPPPDIAWLWHCHRLAPKEYCDYCVETFGMIVEANPPFAVAAREGPADGDSAILQTRALWKDRYPDEPFFLQRDHASSALSADAFPKIGGFDLLGSTKRQATFLWQVSGARFSDDDFLAEGVENYAKFLLLKPKAMQKRITLVPTYQIDLMWHTHMLTSMQQYHADCLRIMHSKLHHDDSLTDRSEGGHLDRSYQATKELWQKEYGTDYVVCGGMYRGEPPEEYFSPTEASLWIHDGAVFCGVAAGSNQHLIGRVGATSASPQPLQWAPLVGGSADGSMAFIPTHLQTRNGVKVLKYKENYVLGRIHSRTGYYHIETKEAHYILLQRVKDQIRDAESSLACRCCVSRRSDPLRDKELEALWDTADELKERLRASSPHGGMKKVRRQLDERSFYGPEGVWLYPEIYKSAGGACGGTVASCKSWEAIVDVQLDAFPNLFLVGSEQSRREWVRGRRRIFGRSRRVWWKEARGLWRWWLRRWWLWRWRLWGWWLWRWLNNLK
jgi:Glycine-rich domain-containing protein-like